MAKVFDPRWQTSEGTYFKDPGSGADLSPATERVKKCELTAEGKFIWPRVLVNGGEEVKIAFRLFTSEEKQIYKQYRNRGKEIHGAHSHVESVHINVESVHINVDGVHINVDGAHSNVEEGEVHIKSSYVPRPSLPVLGSAPAGSTLAWIRNCDKVYGVWLFDNVTYDLLGMEGYSGYQPIARSLIPREDRERLNIPLGA